MTALEILCELTARGVRVTARGDRLVYDAPSGAMTPDVVERLKACKTELLALLAKEPEPAASEHLETHAGRETRRFMAVCRPWPDGRGWYDPAQARIASALSQTGLDSCIADKHEV